MFGKFSSGKRRARSVVAGIAVSLGLCASAPQAQALTILLDFVTGNTTDLFSVDTTTANYAPFSFASMTTSQIQTSILDAVINDYLYYPTHSANSLSPLPAGKQLNINFEISTGLTKPLDNDPEYYYMAIGNRAAGETISAFGQSCLNCVRTSTGGKNAAGNDLGKVVGSVLVDNIAGLASYAHTDAQRINLLAGTVAHEIGHTLSLQHPSGPLANPGASIYSLEATGASPTLMPDAERIKDRSFAYSEFSQLISAVGLRDVAPVPEPANYAMLLVGLGLVGFAARKKTSAVA